MQEEVEQLRKRNKLTILTRQSNIDDALQEAYRLGQASVIPPEILTSLNEIGNQYVDDDSDEAFETCMKRCYMLCQREWLARAEGWLKRMKAQAVNEEAIEARWALNDMAYSIRLELNELKGKE